MRKRSKLLGAAALEMLPRDPCSSHYQSACGRIHCGQCIQWVAGGAYRSAFVPGNPAGLAQSGRVMVSVGEFDAYARVSIRSSNITVDFSGSIADCWMDDTCIYVGDPTSSTRYLDVNVIGPRGRPMVVGGQHPFLEVNAQKTRVFNMSTRLGVKGGSFSSYLQVDDDQAFLLDGLDTSAGQTNGTDGVLCNAATCNSVIYAPGGKTWAVGWLKHLNLTMGCDSNGMDWESGNSLRITDSVIQGYPQYAIRAGIAHGGLPRARSLRMSMAKSGIAKIRRETLAWRELLRRGEPLSFTAVWGCRAMHHCSRILEPRNTAITSWPGVRSSECQILFMPEKPEQMAQGRSRLLLRISLAPPVSISCV